LLKGSDMSDWVNLFRHMGMDLSVLIFVGIFPAAAMWSRELKGSFRRGYLACIGLAFAAVAIAHIRIFDTLVSLPEYGLIHRLGICVFFGIVALPLAWGASREKIPAGWALTLGVILWAIPITQVMGLKFFKPALAEEIALGRSLRSIETSINMKDSDELARNLRELKMPSDTVVFDLVIAPVLRGALYSMNTDVAQLAATKLGERGDPKALPFILDAMVDASPIPRKAMEDAAESLSNSTDSGAILKDMVFSSTGLTRKYAVQILAKQHPRELEEILPQLLQSDDEELRDMVAELVRSGKGKLNISRLLNGLIASLGSANPKESAAAAQSLVALADFPEVRERLKPEPLIKLLREGSPAAKPAAARLLKIIAGPQNVPVLIEIAKGPDAAAAREAIEALVALKAKEATDVFADAISNPDPKVRILGYQGLKSVLPRNMDMADPTVQRIQSAANEEREPNVRRAVVELYAWLDLPGAFEFADGLRASGNASADKLAVINAFDLLSDERALPPLFKLAKDSDPQVRKEAVTVIGHIATSSSVPELRRLKDDPDPAVRAAITMAIEEASKRTTAPSPIPPAPTPLTPSHPATP